MSWARHQGEHSPVWELWEPRKLHLRCLNDPFESIQELLEKLNILPQSPPIYPCGQEEMKRAVSASALAFPLPIQHPLVEIQVQTLQYLSTACVFTRAIEDIPSPVSIAHQIHALKRMGDWTERAISSSRLWDKLRFWKPLYKAFSTFSEITTASPVCKESAFPPLLYVFQLQICLSSTFR